MINWLKEINVASETIHLADFSDVTDKKKEAVAIETT